MFSLSRFKSYFFILVISMAIFNIYLDLEESYINLLNDIYKTLSILIVFQILINVSNSQKNMITNALNGSILNDEFITLLLYIIISITAYFLIFQKILSIN